MSTGFPLELPEAWRDPVDFDYKNPVERTCGRCGGTIPPRWRHFMRPCSCTYLPVEDGYHAADPTCPICEGTGFRPCVPQDLTYLRVSGVCRTCGEPAFHVAGDGGVVAGSVRHYDAGLDARLPSEGYHEAEVTSQPLVQALTGYFVRETSGS